MEWHFSDVLHVLIILMQLYVIYRLARDRRRRSESDLYKDDFPP